MFIEPLLTPAGLTLAYLAAFASLNLGEARNRWLLLHAWLIPLFAVTLLKATGELPFCGARTALAAAPPFLLLAAAGTSSVVSSLSRLAKLDWLHMAGTAALVWAIAVTFIAPLVATTSGPFNQQQEYHFMKGWLTTLPEGSLLAYNNGPVATEFAGEACGSPEVARKASVNTRIGTLYRTDGLLSALLGDNEGELVPYALDTSQSLLDATGEHPLFYYEGLDCWRTGKPEMMPICTEIRRQYNLEEVVSVEFENRLYGSDFLPSLRIDKKRVRLTLFKVLPRQ